MILGAKILRADGSSIREEGRVTYPLGEWVTVPGDGAYVCVEHGDSICSGGGGPLLVVLECEEPTGADAPDGVTCYRRVRRLTAGVDPSELLAECALARDAAQAECERVREAAWTDRALVCDAARAEFNLVCDVARDEYNRVCGAAWADILRGLVGQCGVLE